MGTIHSIHPKTYELIIREDPNPEQRKFMVRRAHFQSVFNVKKGKRILIKHDYFEQVTQHIKHDSAEQRQKRSEEGKKTPQHRHYKEYREWRKKQSEF